MAVVGNHITAGMDAGVGIGFARVSCVLSYYPKIFGLAWAFCGNPGKCRHFVFRGVWLGHPSALRARRSLVLALSTRGLDVLERRRIFRCGLVRQIWHKCVLAMRHDTEQRTCL